VPRGVRVAQGRARSLRDGAGITRCDEQVTVPPFPATITPLPITRCQICHRTVVYRPRTSARSGPSTAAGPIPKRPDSHPGSPPHPPAPSADAAMGLAGPGRTCRRA
jgi:hypothetical protein